jgi:ABC-2 type transport system ATP-binding protein
MMTKDIAIKVEHVSKTFKLPHEKLGSIKGAVINWYKRGQGYETQQVLTDISFEIEKGDFFGIVGRNGSGKSTLLKIMSQIYAPDSGEVTVNGKLVPFIELGVGFNPELTGRENVFLNGALLGFSQNETEAMYDSIVEFAELERFMDQKLKNYSSGMQVRLAFSIAIQADGDILLLDEVLAVGDEAFQRKCNEYFKQLKKRKKTVILVTHSMENVRKYCNKAMLIQNGQITMFGNPDKIADEYYGINLPQEDGASSGEEKGDEKKPRLSAKIIGNRLLHPSDTLQMEITYQALDSKPVFAKAYIDLNGQAIMATNPKLLGWDGMVTNDTKEHTVIYSLPLKGFNKGEYQVIALLENVETEVNIASYGYDGETVIKVENPDKSSSGGLVVNKAKMELRK